VPSCRPVARGLSVDLAVLIELVRLVGLVSLLGLVGDRCRRPLRAPSGRALGDHGRPPGPPDLRRPVGWRLRTAHVGHRRGRSLHPPSEAPILRQLFRFNAVLSRAGAPRPARSRTSNAGRNPHFGTSCPFFCVRFQLPVRIHETRTIQELTTSAYKSQVFALRLLGENLRKMPPLNRRNFID